MLKIKDNVDLKELEKYGLIERDDLGTINYGCKFIFVSKKDMGAKIIELLGGKNEW